MRGGLVMMVALVMTVAACGSAETVPDTLATLEGSSGESSATGSGEAATPVDAEEAAIAFAGCLRENGIAIDDPTVGADGSIDFVGDQGPPDGVDPQSQEFQAAMETCGDLIDGVALGVGDFDDPELQDQLVALTDCLRGHGVDVDDPDFSGVGQGGPPEGFDFDDPEFQAAFESCQQETGFVGPGGDE